MIRVAVIDDHPVTAEGTATALQSAGMEVIGRADTLDGALGMIAEARPDVVVSDVMFGPEPDGLDLPTRLREAGVGDVPVLLVSSYQAPFFLARAVREGAAGYVPKSAPIAELVAAVRTVATGGSVFPASALKLANAHRAPTHRERQIIRLVAAGSANAEIGSTLGVSDKTVESYLKQLFQRYGVGSRTELAMHAIREGWLASDAVSPGRPTA